MVNVLIACLKFLPQRIQMPDSLSIRWRLLWQRAGLSWRKKPRRTIRTILFSCTSEGLSRVCTFILLVQLVQILILPFRFLYDKSSLEHLYYKKRVAELRKDLLRPEKTSDKGKITSFYSVFVSLAKPERSINMVDCM